MDDEIYKIISTYKDDTNRMFREETSKIHDSIKEIREITIETSTYQKAYAERLDTHIDDSKDIHREILENSSFRKASKWLMGGSYAAVAGAWAKMVGA